MQRALLFTTVLFLLLPIADPAGACALQNAQYVPDPGDPRPAANHYRYRLTMEHGAVMVLNIIDPMTNKVETRLRMPFQPGRLSISKNQSLAPQFMDTNLVEVYPHSEEDEASAYIILHESYARFLDLPEEDLDVRYLSAKRVKPGALVNERLELIPDTWVLETCLGGGL